MNQADTKKARLTVNALIVENRLSMGMRMSNALTHPVYAKRAIGVLAMEAVKR